MAAFILQKMSSPHSDKNGRKVKMKLFGKLCAATVASTMLLTAAPTSPPVAHAGIKWGAAVGALLGDLTNKSTGHSSSSGGGLFSGLSNQKHARQNPTSEEKLFMLAVENNDFDTAQQMLDAGVDINGVYPGSYGLSTSTYQTTALGEALKKNNRDMMQFLLERGANVKGWYDYKGNYWSYIDRINSYNSGHADTSLLQYLIDWGTNVNEYSVTSQGGKTYPIDHCTQDYDSPANCFTTQYLISNGAYTENRDYDGMTPFLRATNKSQPRIMNILANGGANINARDKKGRTASQIAIDHQNMNMYKIAQDIIARGQQPSQYQDIKAKTQKKT